MENSQDNGADRQPDSADIQKETDIYEDEINLIDYFRVLWKHKYLVLLGSVLPALVVGLILFSQSKSYKVTYTYDNYDLNDKNYQIFLNRFYSTENTDKIKAKWPEYKPEVVNFEVWPPYADLSKTKVTDPIELEQIRQLKAQLLNMTITGSPKQDVLLTSSAIRDNFENVISVHLVEQGVIRTIRAYKAKIGGIEENRFSLDLTLNTQRSVLEKFKKVETSVSKEVEKIILQFDVGKQSEYLPVEYQVQATESKIIQLEEQLQASEKIYDYYTDLLTLNEKILEELKKKASPDYTIQRFQLFLNDLAENHENQKQLKDYLKSYIRKIENRISASVPVTQQPEISALGKGTVKKSGIVFVIALMISVFAGFLLESLEKRTA